MKTQNAGIVAGLMLALTAVAHSQDGRDRRLVIQEDTVLPIVMNDSLSIRDAQRGDRFTARIDGERRLDGARLLGRVVNVRRESRNRPAALELEFYELSLPSGGKVAVRAVPVRLNDTRDRGGSWSAKKPDNRKQNTVIGGLLGGALIGSMISRAGQGAAIGAVAGILIAESGGAKTRTASSRVEPSSERSSNETFAFQRQTMKAIDGRTRTTARVILTMRRSGSMAAPYGSIPHRSDRAAVGWFPWNRPRASSISTTTVRKVAGFTWTARRAVCGSIFGKTSFA